MTVRKAASTRIRVRRFSGRRRLSNAALEGIAQCHSDPEVAGEESRINFGPILHSGNRPEMFRFVQFAAGRIRCVVDIRAPFVR